MTRRYDNATPTPTVATRPPLAPAYSVGQAVKLALLRGLAVVVALGTVTGAGALALEYINTEALLWAGGAFALALVGGVVALAMWTGAGAVEAHTWARELAAGQDLDGDGYVGEPKRQRIRLVPLSAHGRNAEPLVMYEEEQADEPEVDGFGLVASDVAAFIAEAGRRGLAKSAWLQAGRDRYKLPSGATVTRGTWDRCTGELRRLGWAVDTGNGLQFVQRTGEMLRQLDDLF